MLHPTTAFEIAMSIQNDRLKEADQDRLRSSIKLSTLAKFKQQLRRIDLGHKSFNSTHKGMRPVHS
jgi:hypothetical protein